MHESFTLAFTLVFAWAAGVALGGAFFGALWWTVRRAPSSAHPGVLLFGSALLRMGIVLGGLYLIGRGHWERFALCLAGILMARMLVTWLTAPERRSAAAAGIAGHAS